MTTPFNPSYSTSSEISLIEKVCRCKTCPMNGAPQLIAQFSKSHGKDDNRHAWCKTCERTYSRQWRLDHLDYKRKKNLEWGKTHRSQNNEAVRKWRLKNPDYGRAKNKEWREKNPEKVKESQRRWKLANPDYQRPSRTGDAAPPKRNNKKLQKETWQNKAFRRCKYRAADKSVPFEMKSSDLLDSSTGELPIFCPIFPHIRLDYASGPDRRCWASVDRIVPELGYVTGNVAVISFVANLWKNDGSNPEERSRIIALMRGPEKKKEPLPNQPSLFDGL